MLFNLIYLDAPPPSHPVFSCHLLLFLDVTYFSLNYLATSCPSRDLYFAIKQTELFFPLLWQIFVCDSNDYYGCVTPISVISSKYFIIELLALCN